jgi:hypothetical protein
MSEKKEETEAETEKKLKENPSFRLHDADPEKSASPSQKSTQAGPGSHPKNEQQRRADAYLAYFRRPHP